MAELRARTMTRKCLSGVPRVERGTVTMTTRRVSRTTKTESVRLAEAQPGLGGRNSCIGRRSIDYEAIIRKNLERPDVPK